MDNATIIVRAVNNFDSLLEACRLALEWMDEKNPSPCKKIALSQIKEAFYSAGGKDNG